MTKQREPRKRLVV